MGVGVVSKKQAWVQIQMSNQQQSDKGKAKGQIPGTRARFTTMRARWERWKTTSRKRSIIWRRGCDLEASEGKQSGSHTGARNNGREGHDLDRLKTKDTEHHVSIT